MQRNDFWYPSEAESTGAIATGTRVGQFLFLSTQTPVNLDTGYLVRTPKDLPAKDRSKVLIGLEAPDSWFGPIRAQTWAVFQNLAKILAEQGSSLEDIIQQRIFLIDKRDTSQMEQVMLSFFPGEDKPATMIVVVPNRGVLNGIRIWVEVIALAREEGGLQKEGIYLPELQSVTAPYPQAVKVGQFLFIAEILGIEPNSRRLVTRLDELGPNGPKSRTGRVHTDGTQEPFKAQFWLHYKHVQRLLESQGAGLKDLLTVTRFYRGSMAESGEKEPLRIELFKNALEAPPATGFGINDPSVIPDVHLIAGGIALLPGRYQAEAGMAIGRPLVGTYAAWKKAGIFWFSPGCPAVDTVRKRSILSFGDLTDNGRFLAQGRIDDMQMIMAKAWHLYQNELFGVLPFKPSQVVHQTVYLLRPSDWPAVERVASIVFDGHIPPTTVVPVDDIAFVYRDTPTYELFGPELLEIELCGVT